MLSTVPPISKHKRHVQKLREWRKLRPVLLPKPANKRRKPEIYHQLPSHLLALLQEFLRSPLWKTTVGKFFERNGSVYRVMSLTDSEKYARVQRIPTVRDGDYSLGGTAFYVRPDLEWLSKEENNRWPEKHPSYKLARISLPPSGVPTLWVDMVTHFLLPDEELYNLRLVSSIRGWVMDGQPDHLHYPQIVVS